MRIQQITDRYRNDFTAIYECEHCGETTKAYGYDDANFHQRVVPQMACASCGTTSRDKAD